MEAEPKKLFKFYLDQNIQTRDNRPLFFRRTMRYYLTNSYEQCRWRVNSKEYGYPLSKKGYLRGYIKYGVFAYLAWHYTKLAVFGDPHAAHHHGAHHDEHHAHGHHAATGDHGSGHHEGEHKEKNHH